MSNPENRIVRAATREKRKVPDGGPRPSRPTKRKKTKATGLQDSDEEDAQMPDDWDPELLWDQDEFPRDIDCHYFHINFSEGIGKVLETKQSFIPAGTLLWVERSLFQNFKDWPETGTKADPGETKKRYRERIVEQVWNRFSEEDKDIFTNFHWYDQAMEGNSEFTGDDMASRIDANAGADNGSRGKMKLMKETLPKRNDGEKWEEMAEEFDEDVNEYIRLCKNQHLLSMTLAAHKRAAEVYKKAGREADDETAIDRSDVDREKEHVYGQIETRRVLYGLSDPILQRLMKTINSIDQGGKKARK
ncbi:hypothetical protein FKW77_003008 [Venturia effusa]|uniref:Uncharacterized protein n=1 Tax=Venturia effusa TaxID=50376 RepID=A0A517LAM8_9PEZI|nr:hypothetical protein FKW77_003008 [Venturia effusa]